MCEFVNGGSYKYTVYSNTSRKYNYIGSVWRDVHLRPIRVLTEFKETDIYLQYVKGWRRQGEKARFIRVALEQNFKDVLAFI